MPEATEPARVSLRQVFQDAAACMEPHQRITLPTLDLVRRPLLDHWSGLLNKDGKLRSLLLNEQHNAVSAIEVMDDRADMGIEHQINPSFDPGHPLQADEILAVMDRLFQAEVGLPLLGLLSQPTLNPPSFPTR